MSKKSGKKRRNPNDVDIPGLSNNTDNRKRGKGKKRRKEKVKLSTLPILEEKGKINFEYGGDRTEQRFDFKTASVWFTLKSF